MRGQSQNSNTPFYSLCTLSSYLVLLLLMLSVADLSATQYYVSPQGDDANSGTSTASPFKSLDKVNSLTLQPGDIVSLEGGATFIGHLLIEQSGMMASRIVFNTYGAGKAVIKSDAFQCILIRSASFITVEDIIVEGNYIASTDGSEVNTCGGETCQGGGVIVRAQDAHCVGIIVNRVEARNFKWGGIRFDGRENFSVRNSSMQNCIAHDIGSRGIGSSGIGSMYNQNIEIRNCTSYTNTGWDEAPTGSGIHMSRVDGLLVEYCEAYDNGGNNGGTVGGGGGGIWTSNSKNVVFQYNESHHNKTSFVDGHGFDIDGGVDGALVQYNYAHDNYGGGFLLFQYNESPTRNVTFRYNISENDGQYPADPGKQGSIHIQRGTAATTNTENIYIYNNTVYNDNSAVPAIELNQALGGLVNVNIHNNLFVQPNGGEAIKYVNGSTATVANNFSDPTDGSSLLTAAGGGGTIGDPAEMGNLLTAYQLQPGSPLIDAGLDLENEIGIEDSGSNDFYGTSLFQNAGYDIGAMEFAGAADCNAGEACDDGDTCTIADVLDADCNCAGTFADTDGDGICDAEDQTDGDCLVGAACDDGDACTTGDVFDAACVCAGTFADADGDGICDAEDQTDGDCLVGAACDDGDACTTGDTFNTNCDCAGTLIDSNENGICDTEEVEEPVGDCPVEVYVSPDLECGPEGFVEIINTSSGASNFYTLQDELDQTIYINATVSPSVMIDFMPPGIYNLLVDGLSTECHSELEIDFQVQPCGPPEAVDCSLENYEITSCNNQGNADLSLFSSNPGATVFFKLFKEDGSLYSQNSTNAVPAIFTNVPEGTYTLTADCEEGQEIIVECPGNGNGNPNLVNPDNPDYCVYTSHEQSHCEEGLSTLEISVNITAAPAFHKLYDVAGNLIRQNSTTSNPAIFKQLPNGIYELHIFYQGCEDAIEIELGC